VHAAPALPPGSDQPVGLKARTMDRSHEPQAPFTEIKTSSILRDQVATPRPWHVPVPLTVRHWGFGGLGVEAPCTPSSPTSACTFDVQLTPTLLVYPNDRNWLVLTGRLKDGEGTPTDPFAFESPLHRVDGAPTRGVFTATSKRNTYMVYAYLTRAVLTGMTARVLEFEPTSRILVRLLPRLCPGSCRLFADRTIQFWNPI
jgi:hypothetical protein